MNIESFVILAEITSNSAIQSLLGILVMILGALFGGIWKRLDSVPTSREYDAKMGAIATELEHQEETLREHKVNTKDLFLEIKNQLSSSDQKMTTAIEKIHDKLEDIRENLPK